MPSSIIAVAEFQQFGQQRQRGVLRRERPHRRRTADEGPLGRDRLPVRGAAQRQIRRIVGRRRKRQCRRADGTAPAHGGAGADEDPPRPDHHVPPHGRHPPGRGPRRRGGEEAPARGGGEAAAGAGSGVPGGPPGRSDEGDRATRGRGERETGGRGEGGGGAVEDGEGGEPAGGRQGPVEGGGGAARRFQGRGADEISAAQRQEG
mmetsp:Transcript_22110/g.47479  ORF Transcript_22110/g.47479 Transcript_22110/m.47479 type:complete len:205 (-) Transcript_22110:71-685(-)